METKLVSVVVTCYNLQDKIGRCLESLKNQTYPQLEIIVLDDGSKDDSFSVIEAIAATDQRIRPIRQENRGVSATRNRGIDLATGEYLMFIDGDDYVADTYVEHFMEVAVGCDLVISGMTFVYPDGPAVTVQEDTYRCDLAEYVQRHYTGSIVNRSVFGPWCKLYRTQLLREHHLRFDESLSIHEDAILVFHYILKSNAIAGISHCEYFYIQNAVGASLVSKFHPTELQINSQYFHLMLSVYGQRQIPPQELSLIYPMFLNTEIATIRKFYCSGDYTPKKGMRYIRSVLKDPDFRAVRKQLLRIAPKKALKFYRPRLILHMINHLKSKG